MRILSTILGSVAGLALASGASAADLPMKAKAPAVQYVKICSLYGAGFYYIPGTDTCLKVGGHIRVDMIFGPTAGAFESLDYNALWSRAASYFNTRVRAYATFDARSQTEYGTLRSYFVIGGTTDNGGAVGTYMHRAFIQLAGFTWGLTDSIFDAYSITPFHMNYVAATNGSIGATGIWQWRYTAQFGGGFSASIAIEEPRVRAKPLVVGTVPVVAAITPAPVVGFFVACPAGSGLLICSTAALAAAGARYPDVVAQLQASGPWGRAQVAAAFQDVSAAALPFGFVPTDKIGWAAMVGGFLRVPGMPGDTFGFQFTYAKGATDYVTGNANTAANGMFSTTRGGVDSTGLITNAVLNPLTGAYNLTTAWGFEVGYEHAWSQTLKSSLTFGYVSIEYNASARLAVCGILVLAGCSPNTTFWNVGSRTQWSPVPNFSLALDVMYTHIDAGLYSGLLFTTGAGARGFPRGDADIITGLIRVSRDFWP